VGSNDTGDNRDNVMDLVFEGGGVTGTGLGGARSLLQEHGWHGGRGSCRRAHLAAELAQASEAVGIAAT
jgi:hypothetical protein